MVKKNFRLFRGIDLLFLVFINNYISLDKSFFGLLFLFVKLWLGEFL